MLKNLVEISYNGKTYIGCILEMQAIMNVCTTILGNEIVSLSYYSVTLLPYDVDSHAFRDNELATVNITNLSQIKLFGDIL